jgi:hypothetical protein
MMHADAFRESFRALVVNDSCTEAALEMNDGSRLSVCHRVGERWARAMSSAGDETAGTGAAGRAVAHLASFRLNAKHLELVFSDGSRWEVRLR